MTTFRLNGAKSSTESKDSDITKTACWMMLQQTILTYELLTYIFSTFTFAK